MGAAAKIDLASDSAADLGVIVAVVTLATAVDRDPGLGSELRRRASVDVGQTLVVALPFPHASLEIRATGEVRPPVGPTPPTHDFDALIRREPSLDPKLRKACGAVSAEVRELFDRLMSPGPLLTRAEFSALRRWGPLIERPAYRMVSRGVGLLEAWRAAALAEAALPAPPRPDSVLSRYFGLAHSMAQLLLATCSTASPAWRVEMAKSFEWVNWTPTFGLVRERTVWLAAAAMKSAADFGPEVAPLYVQALDRADHPTKVFDALLGLVAIAGTSSEAFDDIRARIATCFARATAANAAHLRYSAVAYSSAANTLNTLSAGRLVEQRSLARLGWESSSSEGLCTAEALRADPTELDAEGRMIGLTVAPAILAAPTPQHFPLHLERASGLMPRGRDQKDVLLRAWRPRGAPLTVQ